MAKFCVSDNQNIRDTFNETHFHFIELKTSNAAGAEVSNFKVF